MSEAISVVLARAVPSGRVKELWSSDWSSAGVQSRPTKRYSPKVERKVATQIRMMVALWSRDHRSILRYRSSTATKILPECDFLPLSSSFKRRELIIGVSVNATSNETRMAIAMVHPNEFTYLRAQPVMKAMGRK